MVGHTHHHPRSESRSLSNNIADYGESHYVGPIKGAQPNSQAWVDGFPHEPWLELNSYFAFAFKHGYYRKIHHDKIFVWGRPHPKAANASHDSVPRPDNWELVGFPIFNVILDGFPDVHYVDLHRPMISFGLWSLPPHQARYGCHQGNI